MRKEHGKMEEEELKKFGNDKKKKTGIKGRRKEVGRLEKSAVF